MPGWNRAMRTYMRDHLPLYVFTAVVLITGVIFGAVMVNALTLEQKQELGRHLGSFFHTLDNGGEAAGEQSVWQHISYNGKWIVIIWFMGLSIVGFPLIFALDFLKGVLIGFTVGYMIGQFSWKGMLFALVSVVPQNIVVIPAILISSVSAISFALHLIRNRIFQRTGSIYGPFIHSSLVAASMLLLLMGVSLYETYLSPDVMRWVTPLLTAAE